MRRNSIILLTVLIVLILAFIFSVRPAPKKMVCVVEKEKPKSAAAEVAVQAKPKYNVCGVKYFTFSEESALKEWEEKIFKGKVVYSIEKGDDLSFVRAKSDASASALYYKIKLDRKKHPVVRWKWKVEKFPVKSAPETLETDLEDDFAGRVYVIFPAMFITNYKVLEYIWAEKLPVGAAGTSSISKNIKLMVLESGPARDGKFISEERDIVDDYVKAFGEPPEHDIGAVAFMTNAEHTKTSADAMYDEIEIGYKDPDFDRAKSGYLR